MLPPAPARNILPSWNSTYDCHHQWFTIHFWEICQVHGGQQRVTLVHCTVLCKALKNDWYEQLRKGCSNINNMPDSDPNTLPARTISQQTCFFHSPSLFLSDSRRPINRRPATSCCLGLKIWFRSKVAIGSCQRVNRITHGHRVDPRRNRLVLRCPSSSS